MINELEKQVTALGEHGQSWTTSCFWEERRDCSVGPREYSYYRRNGNEMERKERCQLNIRSKSSRRAPLGQDAKHLTIAGSWKTRIEGQAKLGGHPIAGDPHGPEEQPLDISSPVENGYL